MTRKLHPLKNHLARVAKNPWDTQMTVTGQTTETRAWSRVHARKLPRCPQRLRYLRILTSENLRFLLSSDRHEATSNPPSTHASFPCFLPPLFETAAKQFLTHRNLSPSLLPDQ